MKKILFTIYLVFVSISIITAETIDVTAPEIKTIELNNTSYVAGDQIKFKIDAFDDVSGVNRIDFEFADINNYNNSIGISMQGEFINGKKSYTGEIPSNARAGEYYLRRVHIYDVVYNYSCYMIDGLPFKYDDCSVKDFNIPNILLKAANILSTPKLESLTYSRKINTGEKLKVTAKITDGADVESVQIMFGDEYYILNKVDKYTYSSDILIAKNDNLLFKALSIVDVNNNYIQYLYESEYKNMPDQYNFLPLPDGEYDVVVSGETLIKPPVLKNITFSSSSIKVPGYLYAHLDIESEDIENLDVQIVVYRKDCISNCGEPNERVLYKDESGKYYFKLVFDQYQAPGTYYVNSIIISDSYNNKVTYADWSSEYVKVEPIEYYTFEIINDTNADVTSSNEALDIIDKINKSEDDSVISIDTTKNSKVDQKIFEAIKGTNKIISLESNGIRWIFNGKDIKNSKTIDISSNIILARDYNKGNWNSEDNALIIDFKNNGVLPGKVLIRIKADWTFRNYLGDDNLIVYYMNKNNFDLIKDNVLVTSDGYYEFYIEHNSTYVLSSKKIDSKLVVNDHTEKLNNNPGNENSNENIKPENNGNENSEESVKPENNSNESSEESVKPENNGNENSNEIVKPDNNNTNFNENNKIEKQNFEINKNSFYLSIGIVLVIALTIIMIICLCIKNKK